VRVYGHWPNDDLASLIAVAFKSQASLN
jgi:hypothetical protein